MYVIGRSANQRLQNLRSRKQIMDLRKTAQLAALLNEADRAGDPRTNGLLAATNLPQRSMN